MPNRAPSGSNRSGKATKDTSSESLSGANSSAARATDRRSRQQHTDEKSSRRDEDTIDFRRPRPPTQKRHDISDEQLQMLLDGNRDGLGDTMNVAIGLGMGLLVPTAEALYRHQYGTPPVPLNGLNLSELVGMAMSFTVAATILIVSKKRAKRPEQLAAALRALHTTSDTQD